MHQKLKNDHCNIGNWHGKPYYFFGDYLWHKYQHRVLKLPINSRLICPNRDGSIGTQGCIFCCEDGSASPTTAHCHTIHEQMHNAINTFKRTDTITRYIAYFQAFTNTYATVETLKNLYDQAVSFPNIMGLMIGTRPDCINEEILALISSYKKDNFELWIELGMQSAHNKSLRFLQRGHTYECVKKAVSLIHRYQIASCVHIILGIPGESWQDMMYTAQEIASLPVQGVKLHHLHVITHTPLESLYLKGQVKLLPFATYISLACDVMERLRPDILIHRLSGDREMESLVAPKWGLHKGTVLKAIEDQFFTRGTYQGFFYHNEHIE